MTGAVSPLKSFPPRCREGAGLGRALCGAGRRRLLASPLPPLCPAGEREPRGETGVDGREARKPSQPRPRGAAGRETHGAPLLPPARCSRDRSCRRRKGNAAGKRERSAPPPRGRLVAAAQPAPRFPSRERPSGGRSFRARPPHDALLPPPPHPRPQISSQSALTSFRARTAGGGGSCDPAVREQRLLSESLRRRHRTPLPPAAFPRDPPPPASRSPSSQWALPCPPPSQWALPCSPPPPMAAADAAEPPPPPPPRPPRAQPLAAGSRPLAGSLAGQGRWARQEARGWRCGRPEGPVEVGDWYGWPWPRRRCRARRAAPAVPPHSPLFALCGCPHPAKPLPGRWEARLQGHAGCVLQLLHMGRSRGFGAKIFVLLRKNMAVQLKYSRVCFSKAAFTMRKTHTPAASSFDPCPNCSLKRSFVWHCATETVFDL
ncbi:basic proline-rich protein-like [Columba livia]|uniref:basic proline-rich protein-like n=1 Tax=Columba livia TaxID=8932 RepID=UPI0031B9BBF6